AINTIVQEMENNRDDLVVIFAGYPDKMEEFLNKNPGLRSRIAFHVNFDDYSTDELIDIADLMIKRTGFEFDEEAHKKLNMVIDAARAKHDFGNGRYLRNLNELSTLKQASRLSKSDIDNLTDTEMRTITEADIAAPILSHDDEISAVIGF
ncbi:MAG: stage V sporulation protein K, partial [Oscillospiraceae bacterium]|nr:stage V sporulation protein K [Oscillospiraceae bacterium]